MPPGDVLLYDSEYTFDIDLRDRYNFINIILTEDWLRQWIPNPSVLSGRRIARESTWGRALCAYLAQLSPEFVVSAPLPPAVLADQLGGLLALATNGVVSSAGLSPAARSLHLRIQDCIEQRCQEPQLLATDISRL